MFACQPDRKVQRAFYHWQTQFELSQYEKNYLDSLEVNKNYVKFFDVDWNENRRIPVPLAEIEFLDTQMLKFPNFQIIPCIFITNRTFQNLSENRIEWLCDRVREKLWELKPSDLNFSEIQFDCDWTMTTRDRYFQFLKSFKQVVDNQNVKLSATIRLHQFRDQEETGVPPVDKGMLMVYNTGSVEDWSEENSILHLEDAEVYLSRTTNYPIPLDFALPIFHWGVLFRDGKMIRLMNNLEIQDLQDATRFKQIGNQRFEVITSTFLEGYYLYQKDRIRLEAVDTSLLSKTAPLLTNQIKNRNLTLAFYHLDTATIKQFPHASLEKIIHKFD